MLTPELAAAQTIGEKPAYRLDDLARAVGSRATAYRTLKELIRLGFAERLGRGYFAVRSSLFQPFYLWEHLVPSLSALKQARRFGRAYNDGDARAARRILAGVVTLDYRAYELTGLQEPYSMFIYTENLDSAAEALRGAGFWEGTRGRVCLLPKPVPFDNELQRVYLDCVAYGGRSTLDAIAIDALHGDELDPRVRGAFRADDVLKVKEELASAGA